MKIQLQCPKCGATQFGTTIDTDDGRLYVCAKCGTQATIEEMPALIVNEPEDASENEPKPFITTEKAYVTFKIEGRYIAEVKTNTQMSQEEVLKAAEDMYTDADFGELEDIEGDAIMIEDEIGNYLYEK